MTRINLVEPSILCGKHLMAEYREIQHIPKALARSLKSKQRDKVLDRSAIPEQFTLNTGHVKFFYDKGEFLEKRFEALRAELLKRNFNLQEKSVCFDIFKINGLHEDYQPDSTAYFTVISRIVKRINQKPHLYPDKEYFFEQIQNLYDYPLMVDDYDFLCETLDEE